MKKNILVFISLVLVNFMAAQGLSKNGAVVKDAVINNLKVGTVTYPNIDGTANQVLTTDGAGNATWETSSASAYSGILPVENGGTGSAEKNFVDLTTDQTIAGKKTFNSIDGLLATGNFGTGTASSLGEGTRMMWYPKKAAFRAGYVNGTQWDDDNIGVFSTALGNKSIASGNISIAMGNLTTATGNTSTAMGYNTTASGEIATTMGDGNLASGNISTAMGYFTKARSYVETVVGTHNTDYTPSSVSLFDPNDRLFVIGNGTIETPSNALVVLKNGKTTISGSLTVNGITIDKGGNNLDSNMAIGRNTLAVNTFGEYNTAIGQSSLLINTEGSYNTAFGFGSGSALSTGSHNTLIGVNTNGGSGEIENATAIGYGATVLGNNSIQLGNEQVTAVKTTGQLTTGAVTYPNIVGMPNQVLTTDGVGNSTWSDPFIDSSIAPTVNGQNISALLTDMESGKIIYLTGNTSYDFSQLSDGFTCTFINSNTNSYPNNILIYAGFEASFYSVLTPQGSGDFSIPAGGIVKLIVAIVNGERRYYVTGDIIQPY
ncbi:hypothetical protein [Flavobacterium sp. 123]|uniref:hypothetical protein n=1 Tax=Flavobacterium sp. 123 TaxID=2135627 RepID=UPI000EB33E5A|nr:hypothetical protein [Flavobacterium sp. 123]RKS98717.1 trimeric autotransporter adhesin [Flavobacterium sp. 123]